MGVITNARTSTAFSDAGPRSLPLTLWLGLPLLPRPCLLCFMLAWCRALQRCRLM